MDTRVDATVLIHDTTLDAAANTTADVTVYVASGVNDAKSQDDPRKKPAATMPVRVSVAPRLTSLIGMVEEEIASLGAQAALVNARSAYRSHRHR